MCYSIIHDAALKSIQHCRRRFALDVKVTKSLLDLCVLSVLNKGDSYGWQIIKDISTVMQVNESTLYAVTGRLEREKFLTTYSEEHNGRIRRYFKITLHGEARLQEFEDNYAELDKIHKFILNSLLEVKIYE